MTASVSTRIRRQWSQSDFNCHGGRLATPERCWESA